jgi:carboxyl-terminal processing protease
MAKRLRDCFLIGAGFVAGAVASASMLVAAQQPAYDPPLDPAFVAGRRFVDAFRKIRADLIREVAAPDLGDGCIAGMVAAADDDSRYMNAEENAEFSTTIHGQFAAVGLELRTEHGFPVVIAAIDDAPAARAGKIVSGDVLQQIDGVATKGKSLGAVVKMLRGAPGSNVVLAVQHADTAVPETIILTREVVRVRAVQARRLDSGVGYVRISQFQESTGQELARELTHLLSAGPVRGLVLDLRNNPGGLLHTSIAVSAAFLPRGASVARSQGRLADANHEYLAVPAEYTQKRGDDIFRDLPEAAKSVPMVVLVNHGSASASEIVTGALQDHKRATVVGETTFGRTTIQTKVNMADGGSLVLTTAEWVTPNGRTFAHVGITPDVQIVKNAQGSDNQLARAEKILLGR